MQQRLPMYATPGSILRTSSRAIILSICVFLLFVRSCVQFTTSVFCSGFHSFVRKKTSTAINCSLNCSQRFFLLLLLIISYPQLHTKQTASFLSINQKNRRLKTKWCTEYGQKGAKQLKTDILLFYSG